MYYPIVTANCAIQRALIVFPAILFRFYPPLILGRRELRLWCQRARFPSQGSGHSAMEAGQVQSSLPLENFFDSLTTAIRYVRYTPGIKIPLARHTLFSFFITIIPSLMPVIGLTELHLPASQLGFLFTSMAVGSVVSGAFIIPWARTRYSPQRGSESRKGID